MTAPAESATPPPLPLHPAARLRDFPDGLSPVLVKELRQGMRTHFFSISFILLQAVMLFTVFVGSANPSDASEAVTGIFWFFAYATLGFVLPLRGFNALSNEAKGETLELIRMTRMGAWGLTLGKWAALTSQMLLFAIGLLPYILIRYYLGGVEVFNELLLLCILVYQSTITTAFVVGMSAFRSVMLRLGIMVGLPLAVYLVAVLVAVSRLAVSMAGGTSSSSTSFPPFSPEDLADWRLMVPAGIFSVYFFLDFGASRLASDAVNFATRKRLVTLAYFLIMLLMPWTGANTAACLCYAVLGLVYASLDSLTEAPIITREIMRPFRGARLPLAYLLAPGWQTGVLFSTALAGLCLLFRTVHLPGGSWEAEHWTGFFAFIGTITFPSLLIHLFFHSRARLTGHFGLYVMLQIVLFALTLITYIFASALGQTESAPLYLPIPSVVLASFTNYGSFTEPLLPVCVAIVILGLIVPMLRGLGLYRAMASASRPAPGNDSAEAPHIGEVYH